jgi:hypothetical protein
MAVANETPVLVVTVVALIADPHQCCGSDMRIADHAFAFTFFAQSPNRYSGLLAAHDEVSVVFGHLFTAIIYIVICYSVERDGGMGQRLGEARWNARRP